MGLKPGFPIAAALLLGAVLGLAYAVPDAVANETSRQIWLDYNPSWKTSGNPTVGGDVGYRFQLESGGWHRLVLRPGVDIPLKTVILKFGIGNFFTFSEEIQNRWEIRPYQGVAWVWPRSRVNFDHYVRLEERFDFNTVDWTSYNSLRGRYRLRLRLIFAQTEPARFWRAYGSGEIFTNLAGTAGLQREQFRLTFGMERSFSRKLRFRLEGTWQQQEITFLPSDAAEEFYLRFRFYQNF